VRIAFVVSSYYPHLGGLEKHVRRLAEGCAEAGDQITVLTHQVEGSPPEEWIGPVRVLRFPMLVKSHNYPYSRSLSTYLRHHSAGFDVVHAHNYHTLVGHAAVASGLPVVFTPHYHGTGHTPFAAVLHHLYRPVGGRQLSRADAVICVSAAERDLLVRDFPGCAHKVVVIPNGVDQGRTLASLGTVRDGPVVLACGRLEPHKNIDLVIAAFRELPTAAELVIAGDGPDRARLERLARESEPGRPVRFTGWVSDAELEQLFVQTSVIVSASDHEAFGLTVAEGLASGARVVASAIAAHADIARLAGPGAALTLADPRDTRQFAAALSASLRAGRPALADHQLPFWAEVIESTRELYSRMRLRDAARVPAESG
jgi:1,2-diacylglycerol 3-alpha-glucosyltransferase